MVLPVGVSGLVPLLLGAPRGLATCRVGRRTPAILCATTRRIPVVRPQGPVHAALRLHGRQETIPVTPPRAEGGLAVAQDVAPLAAVLHGTKAVRAVATPVVRPGELGPIGAARPRVGGAQPGPVAPIAASTCVVIRLRVARPPSVEVVVVVTKAPARETMRVAPRRRPSLPPVATIVIRGPPTVAFATAALTASGLPHRRVLDASGPAAAAATASEVLVARTGRTLVTEAGARA